MAAFHEIQFPATISYGARGGPKRLTQIVTRKSGFEERNQVWEHSRRKYDAAIGLRNVGDLQDVIAFWEARRGPLYGFRWKDWADYRTSRGRNATTDIDVTIAEGDAVTVEFQLVKRYADMIAEYVRPITKPVAGSVAVSLDDAPQLSGWAVDTATGLITFDTPPGLGVVIKAGFDFDVPVRFTEDDITVSIDAFQAGTVPAVDVFEIQV